MINLKYYLTMKEFFSLFNGNEYISIKDKETIKEKYFPLYKKIKRNILSFLFKEKRKFIFNYKHINNLVEHNNNTYMYNEEIKYKDILDNIKCYALDKEQIKCILNKEEACLVIAGAGSGKSLTIIGKIRYLIETQYIEESEILCISFTRESSNKLKEDLKKYYQYNIEVCTFHKLALNILLDHNIDFKIDNDSLNYIVDEFYNYLIYDYPIIKNLVIKYFFNNQKKKYEDIKASDLNNFKSIIITFINLFKSNIYDKNILYTYLEMVDKPNYYLLINIIIIYKIYNLELEANRELDFDGLIRYATQIVKENGIKKKYKYIIIDEYQDTSVIRVNLIKEIINKLNCKLIVVGDDFQSIYSFSGCNIKTFLKFNQYFKFSKTFIINNNYRNNQELIDVAGNFIMKNKQQLKKEIIAHKHLNKPIKIIYYTNQQETITKLIKTIPGKILILGRNNKDCNIVSNLLNNDIYFLTVHRSKGLEEDNVIILNMENSPTGFPNKINNHEIINLIYNEKETIRFEEERRLFYVALTRSKNNVYLLVNKLKPSYFIREIITDYPNMIEIISIK